MRFTSLFDGVTILSIPDYRGGNPYQTNLEESLDETVTYGQNGSRLPVTRKLLSGEITVVHVHWLSAFFDGDTTLEVCKRFALFTLWLALIHLRNIPVVWTVHNVRIHDSRYPRAERTFKRWFIANVCDRFIVHCEAIREELVSEYDLGPSIEERIDVIPHGHYLDNYENELSKPEARKSLDIPDSATVFLFFGNVRPYKGIRSLIDAFEALSATDKQLIIAGNPHSASYENEIRSRCRGDDRISCRLEYVPDEEIQRYMNAADAVVLPFRNISTSGSAILGMSFGKALVVPALGCLPELLSEEGAVIYDSTDPGGLREALERATERDLAAMGEHNRVRVAEFDWESIADRTREIYDTVR